MPDPLTWVDPLGLSGCARALNRSMRNANKTLARLEGRMMRAWHKVRGSAAHHIVAWDDPRALRARLILEKHGIHIDSAENGIFLKHIDPNSIQPGAYHRVIHTNKYYDNIVSRIQNADLIDGKKGVIDELNAIRDDLLFNRPIY